MRTQVLTVLGVTGLLGIVAGQAAELAPTGEVSKPDAEGFIRDWLLLGPIFYDPAWPAGELEIDRQQLAGEGTVHPRVGEAVKVDGQPFTWATHRSPAAALDLAAATGAKEAKYRLGYAVAYVWAEAPVGGVQLKLGTNDYGKIYFNGKPVLRHNLVGAFKPDQYAATVALKKGVNVLVAKIINDESRWEVAARFLAPDGKPPTGVKVTTSAAGTGESSALDASGYVRDWLVLGPIPYKQRPYAIGQLARKQVADEEKLAPRPGQPIWVQGQPMRWTVYKAAQFFIDFYDPLHKNRKLVPPYRWEANDTLFNPMGYAVTYVTTAAEVKDAQLKIGVNDQGKVYLNGKAVVTRDQPGKLEKDQASGKVTLKKGTNVIVFKVINAGDSWQGCLRFFDKGGSPLTDLTISTSPPEAKTALN